MSSKMKQKLYLPTVAEINADNMMKDGKTFDEGLAFTAGTGVAVDHDISLIQVCTVTLDAEVIAMTDATTDGAYGSLKLVDLPDTHLMFLGTATSLTFTESGTISDTATVKHAVGTAAEAANDTLDSTSANLLASTSVSLSSSTASKKGTSAAVVAVDGSAGTAALYLNLGIPDAGSSANANITVSGTVKFFYVDIGNNA